MDSYNDTSEDPNTFMQSREDLLSADNRGSLPFENSVKGLGEGKQFKTYDESPKKDLAVNSDNLDNLNSLLQTQPTGIDLQNKLANMVDSGSSAQNQPGDEQFDIEKFLLFNKELQETLKVLKKQNEAMVRNVTDQYYQTTEKPNRDNKKFTISRNEKKRLQSSSPPMRILSNDYSQNDDEINLTMPPMISHQEQGENIQIIQDNLQSNILEELEERDDSAYGEEEKLPTLNQSSLDQSQQNHLWPGDRSYVTNLKQGLQNFQESMPDPMEV